MFFRAKRQIIILGAAGLLLLGFVFIIHLPLREKMKTVESKIALMKLVVEEAKNQKKELPVLRKQLEQLQAATLEYEQKLPEQRELGSFLQKIAGLMNKHNLKNQFIEPDKEIETEELNCAPVSMKCTGTLAQIFEFYKSLQRLDRLIRIQSVSLDKKNNIDGEVNMDTKAVIYYQLAKAKI